MRCRNLAMRTLSSCQMSPARSFQSSISKTPDLYSSPSPFWFTRVSVRARSSTLRATQGITGTPSPNHAMKATRMTALELLHGSLLDTFLTPSAYQAAHGSATFAARGHTQARLGVLDAPHASPYNTPGLAYLRQTGALALSRSCRRQETVSGCERNPHARDTGNLSELPSDSTILQGHSRGRRCMAPGTKVVSSLQLAYV